jgi:3-oxoacyl-[acyl-carrier protein] reductase
VSGAAAAQPAPERVAIVTGGGKGIGRATSLALAAGGARVVVAYRSDDAAADATVQDIVAAGGDGFAFRADVTEEDDVAALVAAVLERYGRLDILVNNAGFADQAKITEVSRELWDRTLHGNLTSAFLCTRAVVPIMSEQGYGRIVNVSSQAGRSGGLTGPHYAAAKAGMIALTKSIGRAYAGVGITSNAVAPNYTETELLDRLGVSERREQLFAAIPMGRFAKPEEVGAVIAFLCSDAAAYVTGEVVGITGGV